MLLFLSCSITYLLLTSIGTVVSLRKSGYARTVLSGTLIILLLSLSGSAALSKSYWGYVLTPPTLDWPLTKIEKILGFSNLELSSKGITILNKEKTMEAKIQDTIEYSYQEKSQEILKHFKNRGELSHGINEISNNNITRLYDAVKASGLLYEGQPGYNNAKDLGGHVIKFQGKDQKFYLLIRVRGGEVSNDHYPIYKFLYQLPGNQAEKLRLIEHNSYFYDVAGIEGITMPVIFLGMALPGLGLMILQVTLFSFLGLLKYKRQRARTN